MAQAYDSAIPHPCGNDFGRFILGRGDVTGHRENALSELRNQYPETYDKLIKLHEKGFRTCSNEYRNADDSPPGFLLFYDNSAFNQLIRTGEPPNPDVLCAIDGEDGDFVPGPEMAKLDFHAKLESLKMPVLILAGRYDRGMLPRYAEQYKTYAPQTQFVMFEKSGHFPLSKKQMNSSGLWRVSYSGKSLFSGHLEWTP